MMKNKLLITALFLSTVVATAQVTLSDKVAKQVVKDLTEGDYCKKELESTKSLIVDLEEKSELQSKVIYNKDAEIAQYAITLEDTNKQLKKNTFWNKCLIGAGVVLLTLLAIK